jgi:hypothetical protein
MLPDAPTLGCRIARFGDESPLLRRASVGMTVPVGMNIPERRSVHAQSSAGRFFSAQI